MLERVRPDLLARKTVRTAPALWVLAVVLFLLLSYLGTEALDDVADLFPEPGLETFQEPRVAPLERARDLLRGAPNPRDAQLRRAQGDLEDLERTLRTAEDSWRTWLQTRATLGQVAAEDQAVRARRDRLDALRRERDEAERQVADLRRIADPRDEELADLERQIATARAEASRAYDSAHAVWRWKVLAARTALVFPVWALALFSWARRRDSPYITLLWGYWAFAIWLLLYGVWPYLPRYGAYGPLTLGITVTIWLMVTLVRRYNRHAPARRRRIVERAVARHRCPGCDHSYLVGTATAYAVGRRRRRTTATYDAAALAPPYCPACGMELFSACRSCQHVQVAHLTFCTACGAAWRAAATPPAPSGASGELEA